MMRLGDRVWILFCALVFHDIFRHGNYAFTRSSTRSGGNSLIEMFEASNRFQHSTNPLTLSPGNQQMMNLWLNNSVTTGNKSYLTEKNLNTIITWIVHSMFLEGNIIILTQQQCQNLQHIISVLNADTRRRMICFDINMYTRVSFVVPELTRLFQEGLSWINGRYQHVVLLVPEAIELLYNLQRFSKFYNTVNFITFGIPRYLHTNIIGKEFTNIWITNAEYQGHLTSFSDNSTSSGNGSESALIHPNKQVHKKVRAVTMIYPPYIILMDALLVAADGTCRMGHPCKFPRKEFNGTTSWQWKCCAGLVLDIFMRISEKLDFDFDLHIVEDRAFGILQNGSWNGMINDLVENKADVCIHALVPLEIRAQFIQFSPEMFVSHYVVVTRRKAIKNEVINWSFLNPLRLSLRIAIIVCIVVTYLVVGMLENSKQKFLNVGKPFPSSELMVYLGGLIFQRDLGGKNPRFWTARVVALSFSAAMMILMSTYTACITASKITVSESDNFKGLNDEKITNPTSDFKFTMIRGTSYEQTVAKDPKVFNFVRQFHIKRDADGIESVYTGELDAYISNNMNLLPHFTKDKYCKQLTMHQENHETPFALGYRKDFRYGADVSTTIVQLKEDGTTKNLIRKWIYDPDCNVQLENDQFSWDYFSGLLIVIACVVIFCVFVLWTFEYLYVRMKT